MQEEFAPFGDARTRILGEATTSRDVVFATYQAMSDTKERAGLYHSFPRDFFDVIVVDECHRGSAQADSTARLLGPDSTRVYVLPQIEVVGSYEGSLAPRLAASQGLVTPRKLASRPLLRPTSGGLC